MAFNINEFKAKMDRFGGPARANLFTVELTAPNNDFLSGEDLMFFCKSASVPGLDLQTISHRQYTLGYDMTTPTGISKSPVSCIFMLDSQHRVMSFFHSWMQSIVNYDDSRGPFAPSARDSDHLPFEIGYKKDYSLRMVIKFYSAEANYENYYECVLDGVYPISIGSVDLSWETNDQPASLPVSFAYSSLKMSATDTGPIQTNKSRGIGLLDFLSTIHAVGNTVRSLNKPTSIQDAVNQLTRVNDTFNRVRKLL